MAEDKSAGHAAWKRATVEHPALTGLLQEGIFGLREVSLLTSLGHRTPVFHL
jgi:hypothetical protein